MTDARSPRGRHREATQNDARIFEAAMAVFTRDPDAPIAAVGAVAGVGKSALYRRYASKQLLLQAVAEHLTEAYVDLTDRAHERLDAGDAPDVVLTAFLAAASETGIHAMAAAVAGRFESSERDRDRSEEGWRAGERLVDRLQDAGAMRREVDWLDLNKLLEGLGAIRSPLADRTPALRERFVALLVAGLAPTGTPLPGRSTQPTDFGPTADPVRVS